MQLSAFSSASSVAAATASVEQGISGLSLNTAPPSVSSVLNAGIPTVPLLPSPVNQPQGPVPSIANITTTPPGLMPLSGGLPNFSVNLPNLTPVTLPGIGVLPPPIGDLSSITQLPQLNIPGMPPLPMSTMFSSQSASIGATFSTPPPGLGGYNPSVSAPSAVILDSSTMMPTADVKATGSLNASGDQPSSISTDAQASSESS